MKVEHNLVFFFAFYSFISLFGLLVKIASFLSWYTELKLNENPGLFFTSVLFKHKFYRKTVDFSRI